MYVKNQPYLHSRAHPSQAAARGFSLLEVMVALVVLSIGLLGVVKLESAAVASTTVAARRSLAALEAASLAASMHVNRGYWTSPDAVNATITVTGTTAAATANAPLLATAISSAPNCMSTTPCTVANMAAYDLKQWALVLQPLLPNYTALINCGNGTPLSCSINITWGENAVAVNSQEASAASAATAPAAFANPSYTLYVEP